VGILWKSRRFLFKTFKTDSQIESLKLEATNKWSLLNDSYKTEKAPQYFRYGQRLHKDEKICGLDIFFWEPTLQGHIPTTRKMMTVSEISCNLQVPWH
jgi:hypothetical protein